MNDLSRNIPLKEAQLTTPNTFDDELLALLFTTTAGSPVTTLRATTKTTFKNTTVTKTVTTTTVTSKKTRTTLITKPIIKQTTPAITLPTTVIPTTGVHLESEVTSSKIESSSTVDNTSATETTSAAGIPTTIDTPTTLSVPDSIVTVDKSTENDNPTMDLLNNLFPLTRTTVTTTSTTTIAASIQTTTVKTLERKIKPIPKPTQESTKTETRLPVTTVTSKVIPTLTSTSFDSEILTPENSISMNMSSIFSSTTSTTLSTQSPTQTTTIFKTTTSIPMTESPTTVISTTTILTTTEPKTTTLITTSLKTTTSGLGDFIPVSIKAPERTFKLPKPTKPKSTASPLPILSIETPSTLAPTFISQKQESFDSLFPSLSLPGQKAIESPKMSLEEVLAAMNIEPTIEPVMDPTLVPILETTLDLTTTILPTTQQQTMTTTSGLGDFIPVPADFFEPKIKQQNAMVPMTSKMISTTSFPLLDFLDSILGPPKTTTSSLQLQTIPTHLPAPTIPLSSKQITSTTMLSTTSSIENLLNTGMSVDMQPVQDSVLPLDDEEYDELDEFPPIIQNLLEPLDTGTMWMSTTLVAIETTTIPTTSTFVSYTVPTMQPVDQVAVPTPTDQKPTISTQPTVATTKIPPVIVGNPVTTEATTSVVNNRIQINNSTTNSSSIPTSSSNPMTSYCQYIILISIFILVF